MCIHGFRYMYMCIQVYVHVYSGICTCVFRYMLMKTSSIHRGVFRIDLL